MKSPLIIKIVLANHNEDRAITYDPKKINLNI
jgi:hypothetical protein